MTQDSPMPEFERFDRLLGSINLDIGASELHGVICGTLCAGHAEAHAAWFEELFRNQPADDLLVREARQMLGRLYQATQRQIGSDDLEFQPYLPGDELPISERARNLSEWCQGYLFGLGLAGMSEQQLMGDAKEAIGDITEFTKLDHDSIDAGEEAELAYAELQEFIRVATLLIWQELSVKRESVNASE